MCSSEQSPRNGIATLATSSPSGKPSRWCRNRWLIFWIMPICALFGVGKGLMWWAINSEYGTKADVIGSTGLNLNDSSRILFTIFYMRVKTNSKHPPEFYQEGLNKTCTYLRQFGLPGVALGDPDFILSTPACDWLNKNESISYTFEDLKHAEAASLPPKQLCGKKGMHAGKLKIMNKRFGENNWIRNNTIQKEIYQIWLNKIEVMADLAESHKDKQIVFVDAGLRDRFYPSVSNLVNGGLSYDPNDQSLWASVYPATSPLIEREEKTFYGKEQCKTTPAVMAAIMAFGGHAGKHIRDLYRKGLKQTAKRAALASKGNSSACPCFDEELVLTDIYRDENIPLEINYITQHNSAIGDQYYDTT